MNRKFNLIIKSVLIKAFAVLMIVGTMDSAVFAQTRIRFARGRTSATVSGTLRGLSSRSYVVGASRGQTMTVRVSSGSGRVWDGRNVSKSLTIHGFISFNSI